MEVRSQSLLHPQPIAVECPSSSRCVWTSDLALEISSIGLSVEVGDKLLFKKGAYKACCTSKVDPYAQVGNQMTYKPSPSAFLQLCCHLVTVSLPIYLVMLLPRVCRRKE
jgi:hypothetical protein